MSASVTHRLLSAGALVALVVGLTPGCKPGARDYCERFAASTCRFQYQCCNARERSTLGGLGGQGAHSTEAECVEELTKAACSSLAVYADAEENGRVEWDYAAQNECLQPFEEAANTCDAEGVLGFQISSTCSFQDLATGLVADGETCFITGECAGDESLCVVNQPDDPDDQLVTAKGTCTPPPGTGDECPDFVCASGLYCDASLDPRVCAPLKDEGDACAAAFECLSAICGVDGTCEPKRANGEDCTAAAECQSEFCDYFDTFTCQPKQPDGEPCNLDSECANASCNFADGTCGVTGDNVDYDICLAEEQ